MDTYKGLREIAKSLSIRGYTKMSKQELYDAIVEKQIEEQKEDKVLVLTAENIKLK